MKKFLLITGPVVLALACGFSTLLHSQSGATTAALDYGSMLKTCALSWRGHSPPVNEKRHWLNPARAAISA